MPTMLRSRIFTEDARARSAFRRSVLSAIALTLIACSGPAEDPSSELPAQVPMATETTASSSVSTRVDLFVLDPRTGDATRLARLPGNESNGERSPDGTQVVYQSKDADGRMQIWVLDGNDAPRQLTRLPRGAHDPTWSPDGERIAFDSPTGSRADIFVMDADGGHIRRLAGTAAADVAPDWSPDGTRIAFHTAFDAGDLAGIWIAALPAGNLTRIASNAALDGDSSPAWSPDGRWIAFIRYENLKGSGGNLETDDSDIWLMRPYGSAQHRLLLAEGPFTYSMKDFEDHELPGFTGDGHFQGPPTWSPNGRFVAFTTVHCDCITVIGLRTRTIVRRPPITRTFADPSWDARGIVVAETGWVS